MLPAVSYTFDFLPVGFVFLIYTDCNQVAMKSFSLLALAAISSAFVIPDVDTAQALRVQLQEPESESLWQNAENLWSSAEEKARSLVGCAKHKLKDAADTAYETVVKYDEEFRTAFAGDDWLASPEGDEDLVDRPPHHGPPDHHRPHHPPHHHGPPNQTVYQLISESKYTTKLAGLINEYPDLVKVLNGTKANYTVFAPIDSAFEKIPKHAPKPTKEQIKALLTYHVSPEFYPAGRVLVTRTIPTALQAEHIKDRPQRLSTQIGFRGLTVNFYSRIVAVDIFGTNGVIHGIDSILVPPFKVADIITSFPGEFSTLELALYKTGLFPAFNDTKTHNGGTLFAPSNFAFKKLGPRVNAFLFSQYGLKYLKALIEYHGAPGVTLYSDAIYNSGKSSESMDFRIPKGVYHIDLETGLKDKHLSVDVARYGRLITIKINGFTRVAVSDGIASDGVIHVVNDVLIPPKEPTAMPLVADDSLTIEDLKEALAPYVDAHDEVDEYGFDWEL